MHGSAIAPIVLLLAAGAVFAQAAGNLPLSHEDVAEQVLKARADGVLGHPGEISPQDVAYRAEIGAASTLARVQVQVDVLQARASRQLAHAGAMAPEEEMAVARAHPPISNRTRADLQQQVREALANGSLFPGSAGRHPDQPPGHGQSTVVKALPPADVGVATRGK